LSNKSNKSTCVNKNKPEDWICSWFARAYFVGKLPQKTVGFCIHLGKDNYDEDSLNRLAEYGISFPFMNVSFTEINQEINNRKDSWFMMFCGEPEV
jgi:hypothetical protein